MVTTVTSTNNPSNLNMFSIADFVNIYSFLLCALYLLWYYSTSTFDYWKNRNIKYKKPIPLFGNMAKWILSREPTQLTFDKLYSYFGNEPCGGIFHLRSPKLLVKDPRLIVDILIRDFKHFPDHDFFAANRNKDLNPLHEHLFGSKGERWRILRQKMSPIFNWGKLKSMHQQMYDCVQILDQSIASKVSQREDGAEMDATGIFQGLMIDVIGTCAFGLTCNATSSEYTKFREMGGQMFKPSLRDGVRLVIATLSKKLLNILRYPDMKKEVQDFYLGIVLDTMTYRRSTGVTRDDALQSLMDLQNTHRNAKFAVSRQEDTILKNGTLK